MGNLFTVLRLFHVELCSKRLEIPETFRSTFLTAERKRTVSGEGTVDIVSMFGASLR